MTYETVDRLRIFVSSTITECARERERIRAAVRSLNHEPILFEDVGARPHPPRDVYKTRLEESHVFVGVYRESYGWIAPDMSISGIEDEFEIATHRGMDRLVYTHSAPAGREPRLQQLIDRARSAGITTANYSSLEELEQLVRSDVTAVVSSGFAKQAIAVRDAPTAEEVLERILPEKAHRFTRRFVEKAIGEKLKESRRVAILGPLGSGKTVILAQLALSHDWIFVDGTGLSRLDLLASVANAMRKKVGKPPITATTEDQAMRLYVDVSRALEPVTIAVDGADYEANALCRLPMDKHRLVFTSRLHLDWLAVERYDLPKLTHDEVSSWMGVFREGGAGRYDIDRVVERSEGNPLYLRFYAFGGVPDEALSLSELEVRAVESLGPREREIVTYAALSAQPLSLGDLSALVEAEGPEAVAEHAGNAGGLLIRGPIGIQVIHEHLRATIVDRLRQLPDRWSFFTVRLGEHLERGGYFVWAFHLYLDVEDFARADGVLARATNQAVLYGGGGIAVRVFRRQAELARGMSEYSAEVHALLNLAYALGQGGEGAQAQAALERAQATAGVTSPVLGLRVREVEIIVGMSGCGRDVRIEGLERVVAEYGNLGETFHAARARTLLAKEYIDERRFEDAAVVCRDALQVLRDLGDDYGVGVASVDLAAALSGIPGKQEEALSVVQRIQQGWSPEEHPRLRAVVCNILTRRYRESGELDRAAEHALEAISIGETLSEYSVICVNRNNLGNVYRDAGKIERAIEQYELAERAALEGGDAEGEASANELIASVLNEKRDYGLAEHRARHACAVSFRIEHQTLVARAQEELAVALAGQGDVEGAMEAYGAACKAASEGVGGYGFFVSLVCDGLVLIGKRGRTDLKARFVDLAVVGTGSDSGENVDGAKIEILYQGVAKLAALGIGSLVVSVVSLIMWDVFADRPAVIERRMVRQAIKELIDEEEGSISRSTMGAIAGIMMTQSGEKWGLVDVVHVAEMVSQASDRIYHKPQLDGSGHWTARLEMGDNVVITVTQLDDSVRTSLVTMVMVLLLGSCDRMIWKDVLGRIGAGVGEVVVNVCSKRELDAQFEEKRCGLRLPREGFGVIEFEGEERKGQFVAIWEGDFGRAWRPMEEEMSDMHKLFGAVILSVATLWLSGEVEQDVLIPKIVRLVRSIGYVGG